MANKPEPTASAPFGKPASSRNRSKESVRGKGAVTGPIVKFLTTQSDINEALNLDSFSRKIKANPEIRSFNVFQKKSGELHLDDLQVAKSSRKEGHGSAAVKALTDLADTHNKTITLHLASKDPRVGTTSRERLRRFYGKLGFVSNRGRNKDYSLTADMYRRPKTRVDEMISAKLSEGRRTTSFVGNSFDRERKRMVVNPKASRRAKRYFSSADVQSNIEAENKYKHLTDFPWHDPESGVSKYHKSVFGPSTGKPLAQALISHITSNVDSPGSVDLSPHVDKFTDRIHKSTIRKALKTGILKRSSSGGFSAGPNHEIFLRSSDPDKISIYPSVPTSDDNYVSQEFSSYHDPHEHGSTGAMSDEIGEITARHYADIAQELADKGVGDFSSSKEDLRSYLGQTFANLHSFHNTLNRSLKLRGNS